MIWRRFALSSSADAGVTRSKIPASLISQALSRRGGPEKGPNKPYSFVYLGDTYIDRTVRSILTPAIYPPIGDRTVRSFDPRGREGRQRSMARVSHSR